MRPDGRFIVLERGQRNEEDLRSGEKTVSSFDTYHVLAGETTLATDQKAPTKAIRTVDLMREPTPANQGELAWRSAWPLGAVNLLLLGIGLAATNPRRAGNWNLLFALLAFVVYFNFINLSQAWVADRQGRPRHGAAWSSTAACSRSRWRCSGGATMRRAAGPSARRAAAPPRLRRPRCRRPAGSRRRRA